MFKKGGQFHKRLKITPKGNGETTFACIKAQAPGTRKGSFCCGPLCHSTIRSLSQLPKIAGKISSVDVA